MADADCGRVVPTPFVQDTLDRLLAEMLASNEQRVLWSQNSLAFGERADLYSMPERAADVILAERL
jgi:UDP-glucose:(heptosyl)LPS alpha-1,3-glucosyltransferase